MIPEAQLSYRSGGELLYRLAHSRHFDLKERTVSKPGSTYVEVSRITVWLSELPLRAGIKHKG